jgi:hypothetical protein
VVKTSAVWTSALACAGGRPMVSIAAFDSTPYAMPSVPSTICATKPIASSSTNSVVIKFPLSRHSVTLSSTKRSRRPLDTADTLPCRVGPFIAPGLGVRLGADRGPPRP